MSLQDLTARIRARHLDRIGAAYAVAGWVLVQAASIVLPTYRAPDWILQWFIAAVIAGFPFSLALAWFHFSPKDKHPAGRLRDRLALGGIAAALVAVWIGLALLGSWDETAAPPAPAATAPAPAIDQNGRIEVVRFETRGNDPDAQRLSLDIGDSLIRTLTRSSIETLPELATRRDAASTAGAELLVTGSVERQGGDFLVDTQVVDRRSGLALISAQATRPASALVGFADLISLDIAGALDCFLEDRRQSGRVMDATVMALYLNTCDAIVDEGNMQRMLETGRRLVKAAPDLAIAHALYAVAEAHSAEDLETPADAEAMRRDARESAARAIRLDPQTPKAYLAIAISYPDGTHWLEIESNLLKVHQVDPNLNPGRAVYIYMLREVGRLREALEIAQHVDASPDPRSFYIALPPEIFLNAQLGNLSDARDLLDKFERLGIDPVAARSIRWTLASSWEEPADALKELKGMDPKISNINPQTLVCVEQFLAELPRRIASRARGLPSTCDNAAPERRLTMLAREGDVDGAYAAMDKYLAGGAPFTGLLFYPEMKAFRADPRFMPLAGRLGLADYWIKSGHWPDFCTDPGLPYDCRQAVRAGLR